MSYQIPRLEYASIPYHDTRTTVNDIHVCPLFGSWRATVVGNWRAGVPGMSYLVGVEEEESNHEGEQAGSFGEGETQNCVREELASLGWVASNTTDEGTEDVSNTDTSTGKTDGSETGTLHLASSKNGSGRGLSDDTTGLHGGAHQGRSEGIASLAEDEAMTASRLACCREDGARKTRSLRDHGLRTTGDSADQLARGNHCVAQ